MTNPSSYFPETFNLSDGPVQAVVTSDTDPRVVYDHNGFRATDINGALVFDLDAINGSADFAGHIHATGLDMDEAPSGAPVTNSEITWSTLGVLGSYLYGYRSGIDTHGLSFTANGPQTGKASLNLSADHNAGTATIGLQAGGIGATLLDSNGNSNWLRLLSGGLVMGTPTSTTITWPGGTAQKTTVINHGLGRVPLIVIPVHTDNNSTAADIRTFSYTATQFTLDVIATTAPAAGVTDVYRWVAIG